MEMVLAESKNAAKLQYINNTETLLVQCIILLKYIPQYNRILLTVCRLT